MKYFEKCVHENNVKILIFAIATQGSRKEILIIYMYIYFSQREHMIMLKHLIHARYRYLKSYTTNIHIQGFHDSQNETRRDT